MSESNSSLFNISVERTLLFKLEPKLPRVNSCKYHKKNPSKLPWTGVSGSINAYKVDHGHLRQVVKLLVNMDEKLSHIP